MKKYQELENRIAELQKEVDRLKKEEKENELPENFNREYTLKLLNGEVNYSNVNLAFIWKNTPQGHEYWHKLAFGEGEMSDQDIIQLQYWVIRSYRNEHGD